MSVLDVGIDTNLPGSHIEKPDLTEILEIVHGLVHGLERDRRHLDASRLVERLDGGVRRVLDEVVDDAHALGGDPQAPLPHHGHELVGGPHGREPYRQRLSASKLCC